MNYDYDVIFLGGGLNYAGAIIANRAGLKCAIIEKNPAHLGGTCLHNGCIPSKMYLSVAETILRSKKDFIKGSIELDMQKLDKQKEALLNRATNSITKQCNGIDIIAGGGVLSAPHTIKTEDNSYTAKYIIIGSGAKPFIPDNIAYDGDSVITSDDVLNMQSLPKEIAIYGDGAIGLEMASFFASVGVKTHLLWRHDTLLRRANERISKNIHKQMESIGVILHPNFEIDSVKNIDIGVDISSKNGEELQTQKLLVATGRRANTDVIQTDEIDIDKRGIVTDEHFETTLKNHYAVGDCNGKIQLAHAARAEVLYVVRRILGKNPDIINIDNIVKFIHTLPCSYANIGKTKSDLEKSKVEYRESIVPLFGLPFAMTHDGGDGVIALYSDKEGFIVGGEIFAPNAEELIAIVAMSIAGEMDANTAKRTILAHPTFSESIEKAYMRL